MATNETLVFSNKSIVGPTSVVVGAATYPQTTLQATGTTTLLGNVFVQGGALYPPGPMTAASTTLSGYAYGNGTYAASASELVTFSNFQIWYAFDNSITSTTESAGVYSTSSPYAYSNTTPYAYSNTIDAGTLTTYNGVWIQLRMPSAITLEYYTIFPRSGAETARSPATWRVFGSNDGTNWYTIDAQAGVTSWSTPQVSKTFYLSPLPVTYSYYRLSVQNVNGSSGGILDVAQWNLYGKPPVPAMSIFGGDMTIQSGGGLNVGPGTLGTNVVLFSNASGGSNVFVMDSNGRVGIGTTTIGATLQITGNVYASNAVTTTNVFAARLYGDGGLLSNLIPSGTAGSVVYLSSSGVAAATSTSDLVWDNTNKRLGIGGASPGVALDVIGKGNFTGTAGTGSWTTAMKTGSGTNSRVSDIAFYSTFTSFPADTGQRRTADITAGFSTGIWGTEYMAFGVGQSGASNDTELLSIERMRITSSGVGIGTSPGYALHVNSTSAAFTTVNGADQYFAVVHNGITAAGWSSTSACTYIAKHGTSSRSVNAAGTLNANGADYAEYMTKSGDFTVQKGDVVGVNARGLLTNVFTESVTFMVKTTNPSYVGGDTWASAETLGMSEPERTPKKETESDDEYAKRQAHISEFDAVLETARARVDRVAFAGQVPVNVTGATPGQFIIPIRNSDGSISGQSVTNPTFEQYMSAVGKVINVLPDGRAQIIVKVC